MYHRRVRGKPPPGAPVAVVLQLHTYKNRALSPSPLAQPSMNTPSSSSFSSSSSFWR